jgi:hypothetical protein
LHESGSEVWEHRATNGLRFRLTKVASVHPAALKVLQWLNLYNPGGSINP